LKKPDVPVLASLWIDPEVTRFIGGPRVYDEVYKNLIEDSLITPEPVYDLWPVVERSTNRIVGHCGIIDKEIDKVVEYDLTYVFFPSAWGKGYATEIAISLKDYAFRTLRLSRIIALIDPMNKASIHVANKVELYFEKETHRPNEKIMHVYSLDSGLTE
jgi:RimJ/RimL family protein N-acetyltransferase